MTIRRVVPLLETFQFHRDEKKESVSTVCRTSASQRFYDEHRILRSIPLYLNPPQKVEPSTDILEHHGVNRCPPRPYGVPHFKRYAAFGILSLNLHRVNLDRPLFSQTLCIFFIHPNRKKEPVNLVRVHNKLHNSKKIRGFLPQ